ncbi:hypothetical protein MANES_16G109132v8 [Manihot esculenta]|uniref:Uncharacterized protein n=1 Tax=Manihot esculenta TaxID=3983 RepID=A0ACB7G8P4_MANES|nr:hypothetical protein MANES_16G109132v8 [Manihot esculenta]
MGTTTLIFLSYHFSTLFLCLSYTKSQAYDPEQAILLRIRQYWQSPPPLNQWSPSISSSHCSWPGVNCTNSSITGLHFTNMNIIGTIPPFICDLKNLTVLDFYNNSFVGMFPVALFSCSKLQYLSLSQNYFAGAIPEDIDGFSGLSVLDLSGNNFTGNVPAAIGRLQELKKLGLDQNQFNGTYPPEIGNLSNLEELSMAYNDFLPSSLPFSFTQLKQLRWLWMSASNLIGEIPETVGEMVALEHLDLSRNKLEGNIPSSLFMLKNLSIMYLFRNRLCGEIPHVVEALKLVELDLSDNNLTGKIPDDFGKLQNLSVLNLFYNQFSGEIPESVGRLPALKRFSLFSNNLSGVLPPELGRHSMLETVEASSNKLTGRLPEFICNGGKLLGVAAFDNNLHGELPESLGNCSSLLMVSISHNSFTGNVPVGLWTSSNLIYLMLSDNLFAGELPDEVSGNLKRLEISNNRFSGKIPIGASWRNLTVFNASNNLFSGIVPQELTVPPLLTTLLLDRNQLSGAIPSDIVSWKSLTTLNMSQNQLSGQIPKEIGFLPNLLQLDLSGEIPISLENTAYKSSFLNNPGLCTRSSLLSLNLCHSNTQKSIKSSTQFIALISSILATAFVLVLLLSLFVIRVYQKKLILNSPWKLTSFQKLDFTESDILPGLTETNLIGTGGSGKVYRVSVQRSGLVAVKRIRSDKLDQKLEKQFHAEVQILGRIRHFNIVKLLCYIYNEDSKLLVYEYMERSSLDQWLHVKKRLTNVSGSACLDWPTRFRIAVGAAQGLSYLHHGCSPPIIHRDVKSSNILLDSAFNAKIADFGLAKLLVEKGEASASVMAGSFGYIAPEYVNTVKVNEKIDVYSFGVVLLELTTGKEAPFGDEDTCLAKWAWRHMSEGRPIVNALDKEITESSYLDEMIIVFKLGVKCTSKLPSDRPSMREVLRVLGQYNYPVVNGLKNRGRDSHVTPFILSSKNGRASDSDENV